MTASGLPTVRAVSGSTIRAEANRATVYRVMDAIRASGTPGSQPQLVAETGLSAVTVGKYASAYTRGVNSELLGREVEDEAAFQAWTALYRTFAVHVRASPEARTVQTRFLRLAIESLDRAGQPVTHSAVDALTGVGWDRVLSAMRAWEAETGRTRVRGRIWSPVTLDMVLPLIDPALHHLPLTFLDGVVQNGRFMGYTESGQSRPNQGIPRFACNPDLNHALPGNSRARSTASHASSDRCVPAARQSRSGASIRANCRATPAMSSSTSGIWPDASKAARGSLMPRRYSAAGTYSAPPRSLNSALLASMPSRRSASARMS